MLSVTPQAQRYAPFLQAGAEILGAVDRVENRDPPVARRFRSLVRKAFLADQAEARQALAEPVGQSPFQKQVGLRDGTAVRFPTDVVPPLEQGGQGPLYQIADASQQRRYRRRGEESFHAGYKQAGSLNFG